MPEKVTNNMQPDTPTAPTPPHVPTIQELIRDRLIKNADATTASSDTVLAQAPAKYMLHGTIFGAVRGSLTMTKRTLTFQPAAHVAPVTIPVDSIKSAHTTPSSLTVVADQTFGFLVKPHKGTVASQGAGGQPLTLATWITLLKQLQPNIQLTSGAGFGLVVKIGFLILTFAVLMYFAYISTTL